MNLMATTRQGRTLAVAGVIVLLGLADGCIGPSPSTNEATRPESDNHHSANAD